MKKIKHILLSVLLIFMNVVNVFAITDTKIFTDPVRNIYEGTTTAKATISNLKFTDLNGHWAKEAVTKAGAFNMVKGYGSTYKPNDIVSNQEAIAFALRVIGFEEVAQTEANNLKAQANVNGILPLWSIGYLSVARNNGLITEQQFQDAINQDQQSLPPEAFKRDGNATREQVATWIVNAINLVSATPLFANEQQNIYNYSDWKNISSEHINEVEICLQNGIIKGDNAGRLNPKGSVTRAEMAQILANLDEVYNKTFGYTKKTGTVGGIKDNQSNQTGKAYLDREIYIRTSDGMVDVLKYQIESSTSPQALNKDAVVYNYGSVAGLPSLREGYEIEYIVDDLNKVVKYVNVINKNVKTEQVFGKLTNIDYIVGAIQITDEKGKTFSYYSTDGLIGADETGNFAFISGSKKMQNKVPMGESIILETKNDIVTKITYVGNSNLGSEIRGIVIENNPQFSYITILDNNGNKITKNYYSDDIVVEKQPHFDTGDDIGYLDQMFPNFDYDLRDTTIDEIEVGDIVFIKSRQDDSKQIERISASPNYIMKYGKVNKITKDATSAEVLLEFSNGQTAFYTIPNGVFISKGGKPSNISQIVEGDWVKLLVNEAILAPGEIMESVKEVIIEQSGHLIGNIIRGKVGTIDTIQKEISVTNSYILDKDGWSDFKQVRKLSLANNDIQYYYDGKKVDLPFVQKYLKRSDGEIYVALEDNYAGNVISKITFRTGRDDILSPDLVVNTNNMDTFALAGGGTIKTDEGTIVRKDGKLVQPSGIAINDYARVSLNGDGKAAIVDIYDAPINDTINIARGRVSAIDEGRSFTVESMSLLSGNNWTYSPVDRKFTIDGETVYITPDGVQSIDKFIGVTENSSVGKAVTIVYDGSKATHIIDMPYPTKVVSGKVFSKGDGIVLKDGKFLNDKGAWEAVGIKDSSINLKPETNTIVIKNNKVLTANELQQGDLVRVLTESLPDKINGGIEVIPRIVFVGN